MKYLTYFSRLIVGILFIFSGLIKANDTIGFSYKLEEYFSADVLNLEFLIPLALVMAAVICVFEVVAGIMVLIGSRPKLTNWSLMLMIIFFTFLIAFLGVSRHEEPRNSEKTFLDFFGHDQKAIS